MVSEIPFLGLYTQAIHSIKFSCIWTSCIIIPHTIGIITHHQLQEQMSKGYVRGAPVWQDKKHNGVHQQWFQRPHKHRTGLYIGLAPDGTSNLTIGVNFRAKSMVVGEVDGWREKYFKLPEAMSKIFSLPSETSPAVIMSFSTYIYPHLWLRITRMMRKTWVHYFGCIIYELITIWQSEQNCQKRTLSFKCLFPSFNLMINAFFTRRLFSPIFWSNNKPTKPFSKYIFLPFLFIILSY